MMKVYVLLIDFGCFDGGARIIAIYNNKEEADRQKKIQDEENRGYPEVRVEEYDVQG
jgi:hypothetical protein